MAPLWRLLAAALALAAGCGSVHANGARPVAAMLTIAYSAGAHQWRLTCRPAGGTHPDPRAACAELAAHAADLGPARRPCVLLLRRGAPRAVVTGHVGGRRIDRLVRPACDAAAWRHLHVLLTGR